MGIIGTVMGLINVLKNLSQPATLGPAISVAFIATLYGVGTANCVFFPIATRLKGLSESEIEMYTMTLEGVMSIQAGDNPRVVTDKLLAFIPPSDRAAAASTAPDDLVARADELAAA
jgi:chemotaxis protein MotA